jgi:hypothetical protein
MAGTAASEAGGLAAWAEIVFPEARYNQKRER